MTHLDTGNPDTFNAWVDALRDNPAALEGFARWAEPELRKIAMGLVVHFNEDPNRFYADALTTVHEEFVLLCREVGAGLHPNRFQSLLSFRSTRSFSAFLDSPVGRNPASGMTGLRRRHERLVKVRRELEEQGHHPTDAEVVAEANRRIDASRSNPVRQGMRLTVDDLRTVPAAAEFDPQHHDEHHTLDEPDGSALSPIERRELARRVLLHAATLGDDWQEVATWMWKSHLTGEPNDLPTIEGIRVRFNLTLSRSRLLWRELTRTIPARILATDFGITRDDDATAASEPEPRPVDEAILQSLAPMVVRLAQREGRPWKTACEWLWSQRQHDTFPSALALVRWGRHHNIAETDARTMWHYLVETWPEKILAAKLGHPGHWAPRTFGED